MSIDVSRMKCPYFAMVRSVPGILPQPHTLFCLSPLPGVSYFARDFKSTAELQAHVNECCTLRNPRECWVYRHYMDFLGGGSVT